jgi:hypothetical protein
LLQRSFATRLEQGCNQAAFGPHEGQFDARHHPAGRVDLVGPQCVIARRDLLAPGKHPAPVAIGHGLADKPVVHIDANSMASLGAA